VIVCNLGPVRAMVDRYLAGESLRALAAWLNHLEIAAGDRAVLARPRRCAASSK
jgi:hypothetical protein